jgi:glycosyl transferase, family 25
MSIPVFVIHCKKGLEQRRKSIESQMAAQHLPFEFILDFDRNEIDEATANRFFAPSFPKTLMSVCMKHRLATQIIVERGYDRALIFEDDVILLNHFGPSLNKIIEESRQIKDEHVVYLSNYGNRYTPRSRLVKGQVLYENTHSRACDSYLITQEACRKRLEWWEHNKYTLAIDHQFNVIDPKMGIRIFWAEDPIIEQGSENGTFESCIESRHRKTLKRIRWNLDKFYKKHILRNIR